MAIILSTQALIIIDDKLFFQPDLQSLLFSDVNLPVKILDENDRKRDGCNRDFG